MNNGSTLTITGDVTNSEFIVTDYNNSGGKNTVPITGVLTNNGDFGLGGAGDSVSISGSVTNNALFGLRAPSSRRSCEDDSFTCMRV